jgi:hypothetical protein
MGLGPELGEISFQAFSMSATYDPTLEHWTIKMLHAAPIGPDALAILQCERTASSGRKLIVTTFGRSYVFLPARFNSYFIQPHAAVSHGTLSGLFTGSSLLRNWNMMNPAS